MNQSQGDVADAFFTLADLILEVGQLTLLEAQLKTAQDEEFALRSHIQAHATTRDQLRFVDRERDQAVAGHCALFNTISNAIVSSQTTTTSNRSTSGSSSLYRSHSPPAPQRTRPPAPTSGLISNILSSKRRCLQ